MKPQKGDRTLIKQMNQRLVLQLIQGCGPISRRDLAKASGLSAASVSGITSALIELGLVFETGEAEELGRAGRKAVLLKLNPNAGMVVGVKLAIHAISCVLTDLEANVLGAIEYAFPSTDPTAPPFDPQATIQITIETIQRLLAMKKVDPARLLGIGIGLNGIVDAEAGLSCTAPHFGWHNISFATPIADYFGVPVYMENDTRTLTLAEQWFGAGREVDNFIAIGVGYGIGSGIVINKQLYRGATSAAGEFGHIVVQKDGPLCSCGKRGCLETLAAIPGIMQMISTALASGESSLISGVEPIALEAIVKAAEAGDLLSLRALDTAGRWLGIGIANLVNILNPQLLIINGEAIVLGAAYFASMEKSLRENVFDSIIDSMQIVYESGNNEIWARGAACVVLNSLFTQPVSRHSAQVFFRNKLLDNKEH